MHTLKTWQRRAGWMRPAVAVLMLGLWLGVLLLAVSERLHHALHEDAGELHHQCPVVTLAKGLLLGAASLVAAAVVVVFREVRFSSFVPVMRTRLDVGLAPGRGPPVVVVSC